MDEVAHELLARFRGELAWERDFELAGKAAILAALDHLEGIPEVEAVAQPVERVLLRFNKLISLPGRSCRNTPKETKALPHLSKIELL